MISLLHCILSWTAQFNMFPFLYCLCFGWRTTKLTLIFQSICAFQLNRCRGTGKQKSFWIIFALLHVAFLQRHATVVWSFHVFLFGESTLIIYVAINMPSREAADPNRKVFSIAVYTVIPIVRWFYSVREAQSDWIKLCSITWYLQK